MNDKLVKQLNIRYSTRIQSNISAMVHRKLSVLQVVWPDTIPADCVLNEFVCSTITYIIIYASTVCCSI